MTDMQYSKILFRKIFNHSVLVGMLSIFCPSVINVQPFKIQHKNDLDSLASDWQKVGSYIKQAYDSRQK